MDSTSRRNNGTTVNLSSSERTQNSPIGNAFLFSGSEYINLPDNADFKPNYVTVEALARVNADNPDWARIFDRYHHPSTGYALAINNTGKYLFHPRLTGGVYSAATSSQVVENDGAWHNVAGSYQSGKTRLFNDGALNQETSTNNDIIAHESSETPRIGVGVYDPYYFRGTISEIRISDIARSAGWLKATDYSNTDGLLSFSVSPDTTAPGEVTNLVVETHSDGTSVHLDWSAYEESVAGDVDEYRIYVQTAPFDTISGLTPIFTVPAGTQTYTVQNLTPGTTYYIAVAVVDMVGNVDTAVSPTAVTPVDTTPPRQPISIPGSSPIFRLTETRWTRVVMPMTDQFRGLFFQKTGLVCPKERTRLTGCRIISLGRIPEAFFRRDLIREPSASGSRAPIPAVWMQAFSITGRQKTPLPIFISF